MPIYQYTAMNSAGKQESGTLDAPNEDQAIAKLRGEGLFPTAIGLAKGGGKSAASAQGKKKMNKEISFNFGSKNMKQAELTLFTRQLAILLDAGLPLIRSLKTLERQTKSPGVKSVLGSCSTAVEGGGTFSEALGQHPKSFDKLYLNMVRAGEAAGAMESILNRLAEFMEKAARITAKVKAAMIYPAVVLSVALLITAALMIFIVPRFQEIFKSLLGDGKRLPALTEMVISISGLMQGGLGIFSSDEQSIMKYFEGPIEIIIAIILLVLLFRTVTSVEAGRIFLDKIKFRAPLFGPIISKTAISRFARTLGTLLSAGVPVLQALQIVKETAGNAVVSKAVQTIHDAVKDGEGMAAPLNATGIFPQMVVAMIEVGEETGKLPEMLTKVAETYDEEVDNAVGALTSAIEPIMIVGLAVIVGTIVIALFLPMIEILKQLQ